MNKAPRPSGRVLMEAEPLPAIAIGGGNETGKRRWGSLLVIFMRVIAALWMVQGLLQWRILLVDQAAFEAMAAVDAAAVLFFAVLDLVAAVGLWLAAPWGGVIWLLAAIAQMAALILLNHAPIGGGRLVLLVNTLLIGVYFLLNYRASVERDQ